METDPDRPIVSEVNADWGDPKYCMVSTLGLCPKRPSTPHHPDGGINAHVVWLSEVELMRRKVNLQVYLDIVAVALKRSKCMESFRLTFTVSHYTDHGS